jgi:3-phenylpropionate/trans-cinnamate dioxygenase ferredoxin reductase subunit
MNFRDRVQAFEGNGRVERVVTANGLRLDCDFAVVGLGVEPVAELVLGAGVEVDNGILVDELCRTNVERIYAAGDVANHLHPLFGRRIRIEHWQNAIRQGRAAALSMLDKGEPYAEVHWFWSDQYDHNLQYAGFHTEWDDLVVRGSVEDRSFVAFYMKDGRVQAAVSMDRGSEMQPSMALIRTGGAVDAETLRDETRELSALSS